MIKFFKRLFCSHFYLFVRNIYGDEINYIGKRSIWKCEKCGKIQYNESLNNLPKQ